MRVTDKMVMFFTEKDIFSNWYRSDFFVKGVKFNCMEQFMMYAKARFFNDLETAEKIMATQSPREQKKLGREVKNYDENAWDKRRLSIVAHGCFCKFWQNDELKAKLLDTGNRLLVEASPYDKVWGAGLSENDPRIEDPSHWQGRNLLGSALVTVRGWIAREVEIERDWIAREVEIERDVEQKNEQKSRRNNAQEMSSGPIS